MKPVLISTEKLMGQTGHLVIFLILAGLLWGVCSYFKLFELTYSLYPYPQYSDYVIIVVIAGLFSSLIYSLTKKYQLKKQGLIVFSVKMALDESYHYVQAPSAMLSSDFLKYYFMYLMQGKKRERYRAILNKNFAVLAIYRSDDVIRIDPRSTLAAGGIKNGDICQVVAKPKEVVS